MKPLSKRIPDWTDFDVAEFELGVVLGLFNESHDSFNENKHVFWTNNTVGNFLIETLHGLEALGLIERSADGDQYRWKPTPASAD